VGCGDFGGEECIFIEPKFGLDYGISGMVPGGKK